ncbi:phytanoyl-CoA dioxygenase family protein [Candidatus Pelagibacter bacterium nBUS_44]|uniref:phytanoyl-CoA dioxygenase family protein n=1 Tax=Candidatus Pelagibacter bacterium nBUS_44 TaxID=3374195 RepID=UPI003EBE8E59
MISLTTRKNLQINVPENQLEDSSKKFYLENIMEAIEYYKDNGYVIFKEFVEKEDCNEILKIWNTTIKKYDGKIYRQTTGKAEKNILNKNNWIMNPVLNLQSLNPFKFEELRKKVEDKIFKNSKICSFLKQTFKFKPKIIQSMYFEGNSATHEHQDTYYLDSETIGNLTAAWIALEEIKADAGRFFVCAGSHKIDIKKLKYYDKILSNHDLYIDELILICKKNDYRFKAPYLDKGDVLFWNSKTLHGSLNSQSKTFSRSSITLHAIPANEKFLHWHKHFIKTPVDDLVESFIYRRKDQKLFLNRIILFFESNFPNLIYLLKKIIIKIIYKQRHY